MYVTNTVDLMDYYDYEYTDDKSDTEDGYYKLGWYYPGGEFYISPELSGYVDSSAYYPIMPCMNQTVGKLKLSFGSKLSGLPHLRFHPRARSAHRVYKLYFVFGVLVL